MREYVYKVLILLVLLCYTTYDFYFLIKYVLNNKYVNVSVFYLHMQRARNIRELLENPMATGSEDMQIDNNVVMDVEEFNPVNTDEVGEQENGATSPNDIEESP